MMWLDDKANLIVDTDKISHEGKYTIIVGAS